MDVFVVAGGGLVLVVEMVLSVVVVVGAATGIAVTGFRGLLPGLFT